MDKPRTFVVGERQPVIIGGGSGEDPDGLKATRLRAESGKHRTLSDFEEVDLPSTESCQSQASGSQGLRRTQVWVGMLETSAPKKPVKKAPELLGTRLGFGPASAEEVAVVPGPPDEDVVVPGGPEPATDPGAMAAASPVVAAPVPETAPRRGPGAALARQTNESRQMSLLLLAAGLALVGLLALVVVIALISTSRKWPVTSVARPPAATVARPGRPRASVPVAKPLTTAPREQPRPAALAKPAPPRAPAPVAPAAVAATRRPRAPATSPRRTAAVGTRRVSAAAGSRRRRAQRRTATRGQRRRPAVRVRYDREHNVVDVYLPAGRGAPKINIVRQNNTTGGVSPK